VNTAQANADTHKVLGRYTLVRLIGRGGMAEVWKAKMRGAHNFQRVVVVKRILPHLVSDPQFVRMFTTEATLSARLAHPNIVHVYEFAEADGELFLAMEYVHGVNLSDLVKQLGDRDERLPVGMAVRVAHEICLALGYAHALHDEDGKPLGIIHRDVSPSNIMVGYDGTVKLLDFGIAKALNKSDEHTRTGAFKGKVSYMSPEAVESEVELDARTDIFAVGVVLHEMLLGKRLFKGRDDLHTIALVRACRVEPPSVERAEVSPELDRIVGKALARDRDLRYQSAGALAADLSRLLEDLRWDDQRTAVLLRAYDLEPLPDDAIPEPMSEPTSHSVAAAREAATVAARSTFRSPGVATARSWRMRRRHLVRAAGLLVGVVVAVAAVWWALRDAAPEAVQKTTSSPVVTEPLAPPAPASAPATPGPEQGAVADPAAAARVTASPAVVNEAPAAANAPVASKSPEAPTSRAGGASKPKAGLRGTSAAATAGGAEGTRPTRREPPRPAKGAARRPAPTIDLQRGELLKTF
jgi:serine/threonine protein kinase